MSASQKGDFPSFLYYLLQSTYFSYVRNKEENRRNPSYLPFGETVATFNGYLFAAFSKGYDFYPPLVGVVGSIAGKIFATLFLFSDLKKPLSLDRSYLALFSCLEAVTPLAYVKICKFLLPYYQNSNIKEILIQESLCLSFCGVFVYFRSRLEQKRNPIFSATLYTCQVMTCSLLSVVAYEAIAPFLPLPAQGQEGSYTRKWMFISLVVSLFLYAAFKRLDRLYIFPLIDGKTYGDLLQDLFNIQWSFFLHVQMRDPFIKIESILSKDNSPENSDDDDD